MEDRGKTIMCGVLFLDIAEYSKKSVSGQISLKERFNAYLSVAIRDVPIDDRIILDTGDGAALSFLGDIEDALQVALSMRESLREGIHMEPPLLVRMGINLGPVRLVKDINGQPNIVGDGINVAQRIMAFSDPGQILVSRPYYDAVSRLSPEYAGMFHYQGSRTDKHVREHEIYAIGYPGELTSTLTLGPGYNKNQGELAELSKHLSKSWHSAMVAFRKATLLKRLAYASVLMIPVIALFMLVFALWRATSTPAPQPQDVGQALFAASQVVMVVPASAVVAAVPASTVAAVPAPVPKPTAPADKHKPKVKTKEGAKAGVGAQTGLSVTCDAGASVFVDGRQKGKVEKNSPLLIPLDPGKHKVMLILSAKSQVYPQDVKIVAGKTTKINPALCR